MRKRIIATVAVLLLGSAAGLRVSAADAPEPLDVSVPAATDGVGETLVLVVAGRAPSVAEALTQRDELSAPLGELQGFYVDPAANYEVTATFVQEGPDAREVACPDPGGLARSVIDGTPVDFDCPAGLGSVDVLLPVELRLVPRGDDVSFAPDDVLVVTAFRTKQGAEEFLELARSAGIHGLVTVQARKLGGADVGLGQEPHPDGSGPLLGPLPDQESYQR